MRYVYSCVVLYSVVTCYFCFSTTSLAFWCFWAILQRHPLVHSGFKSLHDQLIKQIRAPLLPSSAPGPMNPGCRVRAMSLCNLCGDSVDRHYRHYRHCLGFISATCCPSPSSSRVASGFGLRRWTMMNHPCLITCNLSYSLAIRICQFVLFLSYFFVIFCVRFVNIRQEIPWSCTIHIGIDAHHSHRSNWSCVPFKAAGTRKQVWNSAPQWDRTW